MSPGRWVALGIGVVLGMIGLALLVAGGGVLVAQGTQRDADGYYMSPQVAVASSGYAVTAEDLGILVEQPAAGRVPTIDLDARIAVTPGDPETAVFVGIAPQDDVDRYLDGVAHSRIAEIDGRSAVRYRLREGDAAPAPPEQQDFWVVSSAGSGPQAVSWDLRTGTWAVVVMNADASPGVVVDASAGAGSALLTPIGVGLLIAGALLAAAGTGIAAAAVVGASDQVPPAAITGAPTGPYPARLQARLDDGLSRWLWLVKWLLALPHYIVLALLWTAFFLLTVVAWFAILFTGRYPRAIFDFNVGVMRWTWRVAYYSYGALGTDRYPPFTLADVEYPATFTVEYPERLSRGLALVKWWLLAIPHYLILAVLTGSTLSWTATANDPNTGQVVLGGGLLGLLVFIAAVTLAVTGTYPGGLFDLIMGINRWAYRVMAYAGLMTDEYPPFRLDMGGDEPARLPPAPPQDDSGAAARTPAATV